MENMVNLETFAGGALAEQLNNELKKVVENIYDPNTDGGKVRKITVTITCKPNRKRDGAAVSIQLKSALAPFAPSETNIIIDKDLKSGKIIAAEYRNQILGQTELEIEEENSNQKNVINLQKVNSK